MSAAKTKRRKDTRAAIPAAAAATIVEDLEGGRHRLDELWRDRPVVLVFLRHFG